MKVKVIIPFYGDADIVTRYKNLFMSSKINYETSIILVSGSRVDYECYVGENFDIHKISAGENKYYTSCINYGLEWIDSQEESTDIICFANSDLELNIKNFNKLISNFDNEEVRCVRPYIYDPTHNVEDKPKKFLLFHLHLTRIMKSQQGEFDLSGFRLICFRSKVLRDMRLDQNLPQYGSDYELLVRLKRVNPSLIYNFDNQSKFIANLQPVDRKVSSELSISSFLSSLSDIRSPLNYKYLYYYFHSIKVAFPTLIIASIYANALMRICLNKIRHL